MKTATLFLVLLSCAACGPRKYQVITAKRDLPSGTVIQSADVEMSDVAIADYVASDFITERARIVGHITKTEISHGQVIFSDEISP